MEELLIDLGFAQKNAGSLVVYEKEYPLFSLSVYWCNLYGIQHGVSGGIFVGQTSVAFFSIPDESWLKNFDFLNQVP